MLNAVAVIGIAALKVAAALTIATPKLLPLLRIALRLLVNLEVI